MSYTKNTWQTGDIVSSDKLNHIEDGIVDAQNGYTVETTETVLVSEQSVTTSDSSTPPIAEISSGVTVPQDRDICTVLLDGTSYTVTAVDTGDGVLLGEVEGGMPSFANYPFFIAFWEDAGEYGADFMTEIAGTYTVKISKAVETVTVGDDFAEAVKTADAMGEFHIRFTYDEDLQNYVCDKTFAEILTAFNNGQKIVAHQGEDPLLCQRISAEAMQFVFMWEISSNGINVDVFEIAPDDTVTQSNGTIAITISN